MKAIIKIWIMAMLFTSPLSSPAQYFQGLYDVDSTYDWGWDIFARPDSSYFVIGWSVNESTNLSSMYNMAISADGHTVLNRKVLQIDSATSIVNGNPGQAKQIPGGGYLFPITIQWPDDSTGYLFSAAGLAKLNSAGDTVFVKTYTDTAVYYDIMNTCAVLPDGGYIVGGGQGLNTPSYYPAHLVRTDSMGDTLWTRTYQKYPTQNAVINTIAPISGGRILVGAMTSYSVTIYPYTYNHQSPWFLVLDSLGHVLRDTVYGSRYDGGEIYDELYPDRSGGYFHTGEIDTLLATDPSAFGNYPDYLAHLDTNFNIEWITRFDYSANFGHRYIWMARQLPDSSYLLIGDADRYDAAISTIFSIGWAARVSKNGNILWNHYYLSDSTDNAYFRDVAMRPDGSLVFAGAAFNDTLPAWRQIQDVWLVSTDSNGCLAPGCDPDTSVAAVDTITTGVAPSGSPQGGEVLRVYPNPSAGSLIIQTSQPGSFYLYDLEGQQIANYPVTGNAEIQLPPALAAGMYMGIFRYDAGGQKIVRLVYQPE